MTDSKETNKLLQRILEILAKNEARISTDELTTEGDKLIEKAEREGDGYLGSICASDFGRLVPGISVQIVPLLGYR